MPDSSSFALEISDILDSLPFYVMLLDEKHHILQANCATREHLGLSPEAIVGKYCPEVIHGVKEPWYACPLEEALETGQPVEREAIDRQSGRWIRSVIYPMGKSTTEGRKIFFHMVNDITDRKQAEKQAEDARHALKTYLGYMVNVQEEGRRRIARELHDRTIQKVVFLGRELEGLSSYQGLCSVVTDKLQGAMNINNEVAEELRNFATELRPPALDDLGWVDAINKLLLDFSERTSILSRLKLTGEEKRLPTDSETGLFRIVQEALNNVESHSGASSVIIAVSYKSSEVQIEITDNGSGFDPVSVRENPASGSHFGLVGMQERAELTGGSLEIRSSPGQGTTVKVSIPLKSSA